MNESDASGTSGQFDIAFALFYLKYAILDRYDAIIYILY